jgi:hypothetical protein
MTKLSVDIGCRPGAGPADIRDGFTHRRATARTKFGRRGSFAMLVAGAVLCASLAVTATVDTADARGFGGHGYGGHGYAGHGYGGYGGHGYGGSGGRGYGGYGGHGYGGYGGHGYGGYGRGYYGRYGYARQSPEPTRFCKTVRCLTMGQKPLGPARELRPLPAPKSGS